MLELVDSKAYAKSIESILDSYLKNSESFRSAIKAAVSEAVMQVEAPPRPKAAAKVIPKQAAGTGQRPAAKATARKGPSKRPSQATANE